MENEPCITVWKCDHTEEWFGVGVPAPGDYDEIFRYAHDDLDVDTDISRSNPDCGSLKIAQIPVSEIKEEVDIEWEEQ